MKPPPWDGLQLQRSRDVYHAAEGTWAITSLIAEAQGALALLHSLRCVPGDPDRWKSPNRPPKERSARIPTGSQSH